MTRSLLFISVRAGSVALAFVLCAASPVRALANGASGTHAVATTAADVRRSHVSHAAADAATMYAMMRARYATAHSVAVARSAVVIPAFARKYGMKCSACHVAVPELNNYGRAFRDRGFRMGNGNDDLRLNDPAYWPIFAWLWKDYTLNTDRVGGRTEQQLGRIADGAGVFGMLGSLSDRVSFRYVPQIYEDGRTFVDAGWIRYNRAFGTDWVNVKVGSPEYDLPFSGGREFNMGNARFQTMWAYSVPGSVSRFSLFGGAPGVEIMGHDEGSRSRCSVHVFNTPGAPAAHTAWAAPGGLGRVSHRFELEHGLLRDIEFGAFGAYATWPIGPDSSDRKASRRLGGEIDSWLFSDAVPLHLTAIGLTGSDDQALIPGAIRNGSFDAGMLQLSYVPALPSVLYGRLQAIRTRDQAMAASPSDYGDQNFYQVGGRHAFELNTRFGWFLELTYSRQQVKRAAPDGSAASHDILTAATHLIF
jgi:hypothetical protein